MSHNMTPENITSSEDNEVRSLCVIVLVAICVIIFILLSVFGNILVVLAVIQTPSLREEKANFLVINLAVTDMLSGMTVMLSTFVSLVMDLHEVPRALCDLLCGINYCLIIASMLTLCFISIERFYAIIYPLTYVHKITSKVMGTAIAVSWIQGLIFAIVPIAQGWIKYDYWEVICAIQWHQEGDSALYYVIVAFIVCFLLPGLVLAFNYFKILQEAKKKMKIWSVNIKTQDKEERKKIKKESASSKTVRSLLIVVCAYFICMTPFSVTKLIKVSTTQTIIPGFVNTIASIFQFASCVVNPLIYGIFRRDFRRAFENIIRKKKIRAAVSKTFHTTSNISDDWT